MIAIETTTPPPSTLPEYPQPPAPEPPAIRYAGWGYRVAAFLVDYMSSRVPYDTFNSIQSEDINKWPAPMRDAMIDGVSECS